MSKRTAVTLAITTAAALAGAAPLAGQMTGPGHSGATAGSPAVAINDAGYAPGTVVVAPGGRVVWTNRGANPHTVTSDTGVFDSGTLASKGTFELAAPAATGTYAYHCTFHLYMHGSLVVSTLTLSGPKVVAVGKALALHGAAPGTAAGTAVAVESFARSAWTPVASTTTAADGTFHASVPGLTAGASLRARIGEDISPTLDVSVAPKVTLKRAGKRTLTVTVRPAKAGRAKLQRLNTDTFRWATLRTVRITAAGRASVTVPRAGVFRVKLLAAGGLAAADSPSLTFR